MRRRRKHYNRRRAKKRASYKRKLSILKKNNEIIEKVQNAKKGLGQGSFGAIIEISKSSIAKISLSLNYYDNTLLLEEGVMQRKLNKLYPNHITKIEYIFREKTDNGLVYVIMEKAKCDLKYILNKMYQDINCNRISKEDLVNKQIYYAEQFLLCVQKLHSSKIAHCDLKPENILCFNNDRIKLSDFGFSHDCQKISKIPLSRGTPHYMSHNTLENNNFKPIKRKDLCPLKEDIFSSAVVLWDILESPQLGFVLPRGIENMIDYDFIEKRMKHKNLLPLLKLMTKYDPIERPSIDEVLNIFYQIYY